MLKLHDPDATLDYRWDWSAWLTANGADTIDSATVEADPSTGVQVSTPSIVASDTAVVAFVATPGLVAGDEVRLRCFIDTAAGRSLPHTITLRIRET